MRDYRFTSKTIRGAIPEPKKGMQLSRGDIGALILAAIIAIAGFGYFAVTYKPGSSSGSSNFVGETLSFQITTGSDNVTATYFPSNFTVGLGQHVTADVTNLMNTTFGMAFAQPNGQAAVDTGAIKPNATASVSFVGSVAGNYTISAPTNDCGGPCGNTSQLVGWYVVSPTP